MKTIKRRRPVKTWKWKFGAFDVETEGLDARRFLFGVCVWNEKRNGRLEVKKRVFYDVKEMRDFMISRKFKGYIWWGHNAGAYDMITLFGNYLLDPKFRVIFNKSKFIKAVYRLSEKDTITFMDSLNVFPVKLERLGEDIAHVKLETPDWLKISPEDEEIIRTNIKSGKWTPLEVMNMYGIKYSTVEAIVSGIFERRMTEDDIQYCIRDAEIVLKAITDFSKFLFDRWQVNITSTIAGIALRIFFTYYLNEDIKVSSLDRYFRNSYFGGRTEVVDRRGEWIENVYYYDFNSLYPSVMRDYPLPDPSSFKMSSHPSIKLIMEFEGVSEVDIYIPDMHYPPLPYRTKEGKLIFPVGNLHGWWNHNELRLAIKYGAKIKKIYRTIYATRTITPFKEYVEDLYSMRMKFKAEGNKTGNLYTKLLLNSLYGKFGQRVEYREFGWIDQPPRKKRKKGQWVFEPIGLMDFGEWKLVKDGEILTEDASHSIVSWASYITSWGRIKLYEKIMEILKEGYEVYYTDTDSIITNHPNLENSKELGKLKLEKVGRFIAYAPKCYQFNDEIKVKGVRNAWEIRDVYIERRIVKVKEALRRHIEAGAGEFRIKKLKMKDEKRIWNGSRGSPIKIDV